MTSKGDARIQPTWPRHREQQEERKQARLAGTLWLQSRCCPPATRTCPASRCPGEGGTVPKFRVTPGAATGSVELRAAHQGLAARCFTASPCPAPATCRCPSWPYGKQGLARYCVGSLEKPRRSWVNPQRFLPVWPQARQLAPGTRKPSAASRVTGCPGEKAGRATGKESEGCTAPKHHAQRGGRAKALSSEPPRTNQQPGKL